MPPGYIKSCRLTRHFTSDCPQVLRRFACWAWPALVSLPPSAGEETPGDGLALHDGAGRLDDHVSVLRIDAAQGKLLPVVVGRSQAANDEDVWSEVRGDMRRNEVEEHHGVESLKGLDLDVIERAWDRYRERAEAAVKGAGDDEKSKLRDMLLAHSTAIFGLVTPPPSAETTPAA